VKKFKKDGILWLEIPLSEWKCPKCGSEEVVDETDENWEGDLIPADAPVHCENDEKDEDGYTKCGWEGDALDLYLAKHKVDNTMPCPTCKGSGVVPRKKGKKRGH